MYLNARRKGTFVYGCIHNYGVGNYLPILSMHGMYAHNTTPGYVFLCSLPTKNSRTYMVPQECVPFLEEPTINHIAQQ